jgi:DNA-directed RNA polymerase subunit K/omega
MSDDDGDGGEYGDYEDLAGGEEPAEEDVVSEPEPEPEPEPEADADADGDADDKTDADEAGLEEDAAGTDVEDEDDEGGEPADPAPARARPERRPVDPLLRMSNRPRYVRVVEPDLRVTDNRLHKSEAAFIIAMRAEQIAKYATRFAEGGDVHDPVALAYKELFDRRCPFILRRVVGAGPGGDPIVEEWTVREMTLPPLTAPAPLGGGRAAPGKR